MRIFSPGVTAIIAVAYVPHPISEWTNGKYFSISRSGEDVSEGC